MALESTPHLPLGFFYLPSLVGYQGLLRCRLNRTTIAGDLHDSFLTIFPNLLYDITIRKTDVTTSLTPAFHDLQFH